MKPEPPEHRDVEVNIERQLRLVKAYAEGRPTPYKVSNVIAITRMAIQRAKEAGQDTQKYEDELEALASAAQFRPLRDRILKLADILRNPRIRSQENDIINEIRDIGYQIETFEKDGIDVTEIKELFFSLADKSKPVK